MDSVVVTETPPEETLISRPRLLSDTKVRLLTVAFSGEPQLMKKVLEEAEETREKQRIVRTNKVESFRLIIANDEQRRSQMNLGREFKNREANG